MSEERSYCNLRENWKKRERKHMKVVELPDCCFGCESLIPCYSAYPRPDGERNEKVSK